MMNSILDEAAQGVQGNGHRSLWLGGGAALLAICGILGVLVPQLVRDTQEVQEGLQRTWQQTEYEHERMLEGFAALREELVAHRALLRQICLHTAVDREQQSDCLE